MANIYVIDDDEQLLRMVGLMLERGGHVPTLLSDPAKGLERIESDKPDLLVLDVMMPRLSGHDICRQLRNDPATADLPILVLTARAQEVDRVAALKSGANDYLSKPVDAQELLGLIDSLLAAKQTEPQASSGAGLIISLFGLRGGSGRTTLAVNLAAALHQASQQATYLVDLDPSGGQVVMHLRMRTSGHWGFLPSAGEFGWDMVENNVLVHPSGLRIVAAPAMPQEVDSPTAETVTQLLQLLKEKATAIVLDLPPMFSPAVYAALATSDLVLHVVNPEVVSIQTAAQSNRALASIGLVTRQRSHILNQLTAEAQLPPAAVERGLGASLSFQIGFDSNQPRALAQGVPLTLTNSQSPLPVTVQRMAQAIWERIKQGQI